MSQRANQDDAQMDAMMSSSVRGAWWCVVMAFGFVACSSDVGTLLDDSDARCVTSADCATERGYICLDGLCEFEALSAAQCPSTRPHYDPERRICRRQPPSGARDMATTDEEMGALEMGMSPADMDMSAPDMAQPRPRVVGIAAGSFHTCALMSDATVRCWGENDFGKLGDGTTTYRSSPVAVPNLSGVAQLAAGGEHTCARMSDGTARCWGSNGFGQLGYGQGQPGSTSPVTVRDVAGITQISAGERHTCALLSDKSVKCWGANDQGALGDGSTTSRGVPVSVTGLTAGALQIALGARHSCALLEQRSAYCWGWNVDGQLGDGSTNNGLSAFPVADLSDVAEVAAGGLHTCARLMSGEVRCWGQNLTGQLGDGSNRSQATPVAALGLSSAVQIVAGDDFTCARLANNTARCWGNNFFGQIGDDRAQREWLAPTPVTSLTDVAQLSAGASHACALLASGEVRCWGRNAEGQLGDGTTMNRSTPVTVAWP